MDYLTLQGASCPVLGLGTYTLTGQKGLELITAGIATGYRHLDTAQMYNNEGEVGVAIKNSGVAREAFWITTKVWWDQLDQRHFLPSVEASLRRLQMTYVDLLLIHWPNPQVPLTESLAQLQLAQQKGYARHIGVSNFPSKLLEEVFSLGIPLFTNQVEYHPMLDQHKLLTTQATHSVSLTAYRPVGGGKVVDEPLLQEIGLRYGKSPAQVSLRWLIQQPQVMAIPRTSKVARLQENFDIFDFSLTTQEMEDIHQLGQRNLRMVNPSFAPLWD